MTAPRWPRPARPGRRPQWTEGDVSGFFERFASRNGSQTRFVQDHPRMTLGALRAIRRLPQVTAPLSHEGQGAAIRGQLDHAWLRRHLLANVTTVLTLPDDPADYTRGSSKSKYSLRKRSRSARELGVEVRVVTDPAEMAVLKLVADERDRTNPRQEFRVEQPENGDMAGHRHWLVASLAGRPIVLAVLPAEGEWAAVRYFRTLESTEEATLARYLVMDEAVRLLRLGGVRYLVAGMGPHRMSNGVRQFQRMMGFRLVRLRITNPVAGAARPSGAAVLALRNPPSRTALARSIASK